MQSIEAEHAERPPRNDRLMESPTGPLMEIGTPSCRSAEQVGFQSLHGTSSSTTTIAPLVRLQWSTASERDIGSPSTKVPRCEMRNVRFSWDVAGDGVLVVRDGSRSPPRSEAPRHTGPHSSIVPPARTPSALSLAWSGSAARSVQCAKRVDRVVSPMDLEVEPPFPDRGDPQVAVLGTAALVPEGETALKIGVDVEEVV